jgi:hypothetical protein
MKSPVTGFADGVQQGRQLGDLGLDHGAGERLGLAHAVSVSGLV